MSQQFKRRHIRKVAYILLAIAILAVGCYVFFEVSIKTKIVDLASTRTQALAVYAMNDAVRGVAQEGFDYQTLMDVIYAKDGSVSMIQADASNMNRLASRIVTRAQQGIQAVGEQGVGVRLGTVIGGSLLSGQGPMLYVRIMPVGSVSATFDSSFQSQGINQTRHEIYLTLTATMRVIAPFSGQPIQAQTQVAVAESVIVGKIPDNYVNVDDADDMLNLLPDP